MADKLLGTALQEIAAEGVEGCTLPRLWSLLQVTPAAAGVLLDNHVKRVVWRGLLNVPGMSFKSPTKPAIAPSDTSIQVLEEAEDSGVVVIASEDLRDACLGLYDIKHADTQPSQIQHMILQRLAKARTEGVTQNQLGKDFKVEGNKLFYILRSLECRGLVVRRSTLVRNKDPRGGSIVLTNLVHLTRYAKHLQLNSHQRFEISNTSEEPACAEDAYEGDASKGKQLMINDDLPAMKAISDKLEQAEGKILVVSDLKMALGYRMSAGHRAWRRLMKSLKEAGFVNILEANVGRKVRPCIQLLKSFSEHEFSNANATEADVEQQLKGPKRGQVTEQLVELSVDQQIYDMIDDGGPDGLMMMEVWKRIGLNNKRNYYRIQNMTIKHGILFEAENHKRSTLYRLRTLNSRKPPEETYEDPSPVGMSMQQPITKRRKITESGSLAESSVKIDVEADAGNMVVTNLQQPSPENISQELDLAVVAQATSTFPPPSLFRIGQPYPCLTVTTTSLQREAHILEKLQEERFIVRPELHRWLESLSNRQTMMDRKTLARTLDKLQREGKCKCILLGMPGSTNCGRKRQVEVVLLPEIEVEPLLSVIHERIRKFDMESRGHGVQREKTPANAVPILNRVTRMNTKQKKAVVAFQDDAPRVVALQANGFVPAKMVRVRMLHYFLWNYTNTFMDNALAFTTPRLLSEDGGYRVFSLMAALQAMPLELFLQVVGSNKMIDNLLERCRQQCRICDLPDNEQAVLLENSAGGRLAWLIDILRRLKLIRVVIGHGPVALQDRWRLGSMSISMIEASLTYAMEERIYLEQPAPQPLPSLTKEAFDLNPRARYEFDLSSKDSVDNYWQTLEYFFSGAEPSIARHAFPGSSVPELFGLRSWTSLRLMTIDQRNELLKRMNEGGPESRMSIQDCAKIAKDLNLTLEQVLRVSYEKNRRVRLQSLRKTEPSFMETFASSHVLPTQETVPGSSFGDDLGQMFASSLDDTNNSIKDTDDGDDGEDSVNHISIVTKLKPSRSRRFPWSDKLDRALFFAYAKQRALLGAKVNRVDWNAIQGLPAPPVVCRRRISILKSEPTVKKAILNLCSLLAARYERYCQLIENIEEGATHVPFEVHTSSPTRQPEYFWDNPDDPSVVSAIDEIIRCKNLSRSSYSKPCQSRRRLSSANASESGPPVTVRLDPLQLSCASGSMQVAKRPPMKPATRVRKKVKVKPASLQILSTQELVQQSVGVANAIEFIKLVFLNSSVNSGDVQLPKSFMDALHELKESHVFTAFNFLREHHMVASGHGPQSFALSETFSLNVSSSRFPNSTAEESIAVAKWLDERKRDIDQDWVPYTAADHCGQLLHLFAKVAHGELLLTPEVPKEGVGESEDPRTIVCGLKRKAENQEQGARTVKARLENQDEVYQAVRRERGFPGIDVLLHRQALSLSDMLTGLSESQGQSVQNDLSVDNATSTVESFLAQDEEASPMEEEDTSSLDPQLSDKALRSIENAGEEGLNLRQLAQSLSLPDEPWELKHVEMYVDALESAGRVKKVNAYDHVRVLTQPHAAPYFLRFTKASPEKAKGKAHIVEEIPAHAEQSSSSAMETDRPQQQEDAPTTLPILPWLTSDGSVNGKIYNGLVRRVLGIVTLNPGVTEELLIKRMHVLNPQTVRELLRLLQLDGKLSVRKVMYVSPSPPSLLGGLVASTGDAYAQQLHYYPNPLCTRSL